MSCFFDVDKLRDRVRLEMSQKRYIHTLGVEKCAAYLGGLLMPDRIAELSCAALLHDVAKELPRQEQITLALSFCEGGISEEDIVSDQVLHAYAAPCKILSDFPEYSTRDIILSAFRHTTGDPQMTLFDKIIFLADFIEEGRSFYAATSLRVWVFSSLGEELSFEEKERIINIACVKEIDRTIESLESRGLKIDERTLLTRNALASFI